MLSESFPRFAEMPHLGRVCRLGLATRGNTGLSAGAVLTAIDRGVNYLNYNAAHRGAEQDVFPETVARGLPVVAFTCLRWGALLEPTPDDPPGFAPPPAVHWYRFALAHPAVSVALMAPDGPDELAENLALLDDWRGPTEAEYAFLAAHGQRVRRHAGGFP